MNQFAHASLLAGITSLGCISSTVNAELTTEVVYTTNRLSTWGGPLIKAAGDMVAWAEHNVIVFWDGQTIHRIEQENGRMIHEWDISDGKLAWVGSEFPQRSIYYWDGTYDAQDKPVIQKIANVNLLETTNGLAWGLSLHNGQITWNDSDGNDWEIYLWDGTFNSGQPNITQITDNDDYDMAPSMADGMIAWRGGPSVWEQYVRYWDGNSVHELTNERVYSQFHAVSTSNGEIAWKRSPTGDIRYWDGTSTGGNPNVVTAVSRGTYETLTNPSLNDGKITFIKRDSQRERTQDEAVFYWNGSDTLQLSEWYDFVSYSQSLVEGSQITDSGVFYVGVNAISDLRDIRFVTSTGLCL